VASAVLANLVDGADIGMVQGGGRARFTLKTIERKRVFFRLGRQELERDMAAQVDVLGFVDNAMPPRQLREDTVVETVWRSFREHSWDRGTHVSPRVLASQTSRTKAMFMEGNWKSGDR